MKKIISGFVLQYLSELSSDELNDLLSNKSIFELDTKIDRIKEYLILNEKISHNLEMDILSYIFDEVIDWEYIIKNIPT